jgi:hypothetical protein
MPPPAPGRALDQHKQTVAFLKKSAKKLLLLKTQAFSTPVSRGQKFFAELFFKKATAFLSF